MAERLILKKTAKILTVGLLLLAYRLASRRARRALAPRPFAQRWRLSR